MENMANENIAYLNALIPNKEFLYNFLIETKGYYLPNFLTRCITSEYLMRVMKNEVFTIKRDKIQIAILNKKVTKLEIYDALTSVIKEKDIGFDPVSFPDKE